MVIDLQVGVVLQSAILFKAPGSEGERHPGKIEC